MGEELRLKRGLGVTGLAPWGAVSTVQAASATASNDAVIVEAEGEGVLAVQREGMHFNVIVSDDIATVTVTLTAKYGGNLIEPDPGTTTSLPVAYRVEFPLNREEEPAIGMVRRVALEDIKVVIKAENGTGDPPGYICADGSAKFTAVVTPALSGTYSWSTVSTRISLADETNKTVTVNAGSDASASIGAEELKVTFTPTGIQNEFVAEHELTVTRMKLHGVNGAGFALHANPEEPYPNRVWLGTWLDLAPPGTPLVSNLFDWSVLEEYRGGVILSTQEFSWELTDWNDAVVAGSEGPMYFVDRFDVDGQGKLVVPGEKDNGAFPAEGGGIGMHMSLLSVQVDCMCSNKDDEHSPYKFGEVPTSSVPYWMLNNVTITVTFKARLYPAGAIENPTAGFEHPRAFAHGDMYHAFSPEFSHKYWSENLPSWADKEPIACMEQIFVITWDEDTASPSCEPTLPIEPNRLGR